MTLATGDAGTLGTDWFGMQVTQWVRDRIRTWATAVRRNHGLEHATVAVLIARHGPRRLAGRAASDGFFLLSDFDDEEIARAATEALSRMQSGEESLAVSPLCGTNLAVTSLLAAGAATSVLASGRARDRFGNAFTASMLAVIASQPIGRLVQRHLTTRADVQRMEIVGIRTVLPRLKKIHTSGA